MRCPWCKQTIDPTGATCPRCRRALPKPRRGRPIALLLVAAAGVMLVGMLAVAAATFLAYRLLFTTPEQPVAQVAEPPKKDPPPKDPPKQVEPPRPPEKKEENKEDKKPAPPPEKEPPAVDPKATQALAELLLQQLNTHRKTAGLDLVQLDPGLSRGCAAHAKYLALNPPAAPAALLDEEPGKPGFSEEGRRAAGYAMVAVGTGKSAVDLWMGGIGGRVPLLQPDLRVIGLGVEPLPGNAWAVVLDVLRRNDEPVVLWPAPNQQDVPVTFAGGPEIPDPNATAGFPVTVHFPPLRQVTQVKAQLLDDADKAVDVWLSTPEKPAQAKGQRNTVALIAKAPLHGNRVYRVQITANLDGQAWMKEWTFTTEDDTDTKGLWTKKALDKVNGFRKLAGLPPVVLDEQLSKACRAHARYLALNHGHPATAGLGAHDEDLSLPGASEEGRKAGKASDIAIGDYQPLDGFDSWMATLYHRVPILEPNLKTIGFSCARSHRLGWVTVLEVGTGRQRGIPRPHPVFYPVPDQTGVPLHFPIGGEEPNPIPEDKTGKAGYPVTAFFPEAAPLKSASGIVTDGAGKEVPIWFSAPEAPANPKFAKNQGNTVCLIPREPLKPNTSYHVTLRGQLGGKGWNKAWQFTTGSAGPTAGQGAAQVLQRLNAYRVAAGLPAVTLDASLSKGCQAHAEYLVQNAAALAKNKLAPNDEDANLPGFTADGKRAAQQAHVFSKAPEPTTQVDDLMGTALRRIYLLDPQLRRIGFGCAQDVGRGWQSVLDLFGGRGGAQVVVYPVPDQDGVPCAGTERVPGQQGELGYPISVTFPAHLKVLGGKGTLTDADGKAIETILSSPDKPLDPAVPSRNTVCLVPRAPLRPGQSYTVTLSAVVNGQQWGRAWQFTTE